MKQTCIIDHSAATFKWFCRQIWADLYEIISLVFHTTKLVHLLTICNIHIIHIYTKLIHLLTICNIYIIHIYRKLVHLLTICNIHIIHIYTKLVHLVTICNIHIIHIYEAGTPRDNLQYTHYTPLQEISTINTLYIVYVGLYIFWEYIGVGWLCENLSRWRCNVLLLPPGQIVPSSLLSLSLNIPV